jgi:ATP-dependent exoDNAse (exonuclease V) alpha subunit
VNGQYGYAITAHAAQGSEAEEVGVLWTPHSHRRSFPDARAWLYTAVTRARSRLWVWR